MKINFPKTIAPILVGALAILCAPSAIFAQAVPDVNHTWNGPPGSGPSNNWFDANNWLPATVPLGTDNAQISNDGTARVNTNGTNATAQNLVLGLGAGTSGNLNVVNEGILNVTANFTIGNASSSTLSTADFTDAAIVTTAGNGIIGNLAGSQGRVRLTDSASWSIMGNLIVGDQGDGALRISNVDFSVPAFVSANLIVVGNQNGSTGVVEIIGPVSPAQFFSGSDMVIGNSGDGTMRILDGGFAVSGGNGFIGRASDGVGRVRVSGFGGGLPSEWDVHGDLSVGNNGDGTLQVLDGGFVFVTDSVAIGRNADSTGRVEVDGTNSLLAVGGISAAANAARGSREVLGPGAGNIFVGGGPGGPGGDGALRITNLGTVFANNVTVWGPGTGNKGLLEVDSTYTLGVAGTLTFDGGRLKFLDDTDFTNDTFLGNTQSPDGIFVDTNGTTSTMSGVLSGPGGLVKRDAGTLILTNTNTYTGDTLVHEGTLQLDGSITSNTDVDFNGTLTGTGTIFGNLRNRGVVSPGDSPGTLTVFGNYLQTSAGDFSAEVGGLNSGVDSDLLTMTGTGSLDGSIHVIRINNFNPVPGDRVTVLNADGGLGGSQFATFVPVGWVGLIQPTLDYDDNPNHVDVVFELTDTFASQGITRNQICVGENLDAAVDLVNVNEAAHNLIAIIGGLPPEDLPEAFNLLAPEELASIYEISFQHGIMEMDNYRQRMGDLRATARGYCGDLVATQPMASDGKTVLDGKQTLPDKTVAPVESCPDKRWGMFATGYGQGVNVDDDEFNDVHGYDIVTGGFSTGFDALVTRNFAIGIGGGYAQSTADLVNDGRIDAETGYVAAYATAFFGGFYVDAAATGGWSTYDTSRLGFGAFENGSTNGSEFNGIIGAGYDWKANCWTIGPFATFHYTYVELDSFDEDGGSIAPLHFPEQSQDAERGSVGLKVAYDMSKPTIIFRPEVRAAFQHEFNNTDYAIDWSFRDISDDHICSVFGPSTGENSALVNAGFSLILGKCRNLSVYAFYNGNIGRDNDTRHGATGGLRLSF